MMHINDACEITHQWNQFMVDSEFLKGCQLSQTNPVTALLETTPCQLSQNSNKKNGSQ